MNKVPITAFFQMHVHDFITDEQAVILRSNNEQLKKEVNEQIEKQLMMKLKIEGNSCICLFDDSTDKPYATLEGFDM
jgi:hypothetical protein